MGRKRWWKASLGLFVLCFLLPIILADGEIGCLFSKNVCRENVENCYDDFAFGRCLRAYGELKDEDIYRYELDSRELELLRRSLEKLVVDGYTWTHPYTQCVMQSSLYSLRFGLKQDTEFCQKLIHVEDRNVDVYGHNEKSDKDYRPLAVINFTPIRGHGYGDFANEKYYPPESSKNREYDDLRKNDLSDPYNYAYPSFRQKFHDNRFSNFNDDEINDNGDIDLSFKERNFMNINGNSNEETEKFHDLARRLNMDYKKPMYRSRRQPQWDDDSMRMLKSSIMEKSDTPDDISMRNNDEKMTPTSRNRRWKDLIDKNVWNFLIINGTLPKRRDETFTRMEFLPNEDEEENEKWQDEKNHYEENDEYEENNEDAVSRVEETLGRLSNERNGPLYTESDLVNSAILDDVIDQEPDDVMYDDEINALLWSRNLAAFQRPERVDVKKPGPLYSPNNYAFKTQSPPEPMSLENERTVRIQRKKEDENLRSPQVIKVSSEINYNGKTYKNVDVDHVYIQFNNEFTKWSDGEKVVEEVARLLGVDPDAFSDIRVGRAEVTFKVSSDFPNDAMAVSQKIKLIHEDLLKSTGMEFARSGIGDKIKLPPTVEIQVAPKPMSPGVFGATVAAAGAAAAAAAVVTLIIARKHAKSRAKLANLATPDPEASKDYQDLCRARMQAKQPNDKPESPRITSLSRESESNRSSTSSWGEEAAALTNMDISTGHMVLTYMEDHLKNKDRLDREWAGICAYEADPSSLKIATEKSNAEKNRPGSSLPYDHSRVVLNDLSNADNSDYINASTITDHDPRNPAYIATQGPLPQTSADFWQLVWEQGSVVIVMLTRLTEEGRGMCHRYWPDEGSELYHIYEVHLVSEHIWCDDYLVRSFYLKNLRTGETRTVTQFHFLSWPEHGVPQSTKALLEFRRKVNKSYRGRSCPIVVHCSDGAGRTGTYCLIDIVLNRMAKGAKEIDIAAALEHIRDQRPGMVSTKQQFEFVLVAVAEEVHAILKALPIQTANEKSQTTNITVTSASTTQSSSSGSDQ